MMKISLKIISGTFILFSYYFNAQQVVKRDTLNGTELKISMDDQVAKAIDEMDDKCNSKKNNSSVKNYSENRENNGGQRILVPNRALTNEEICRKNPKISGYKIQVEVVKSNDEANKTRAEFRNLFPYLKVEIDASLRPNYKVLAGSYFTKASATQDLKNIKKRFTSAVAVQYRIFCAEAK